MINNEEMPFPNVTDNENITGNPKTHLKDIQNIDSLETPESHTTEGNN